MPKGGGHLGKQISRPLELLFACIFVIMIGYGVTLTVLPYYAERIHGLAGTDQRVVSFHIGLLTSVYALAQLVVSPFIGRIGDRVGRRPLLLFGLAAMAATQGIFGLVTSLGPLYVLRILAGIATAGILVSASAYVADSTSKRDRSRGMAWFGTAVSLGFVAGPLLGGLLSRPGFSIAVGGASIDGYAIPFLFSGLLAVIILIVAWWGLPESIGVHPPEPESRAVDEHDGRATPSLGILLSLVTAAQFGLALFEGVFVLYAQGRLGLQAGQASLAFMVCGSVMAVSQVALVVPLAKVVAPLLQVAIGFILMGGGIFALITTGNFPLLLVMIGVLALGTALVTPNLSALVSLRSRYRTGKALGLNSSASSLGQFIGPLLGVILLGWQAASPFVLSGVVLGAVGIAIAISYPMRVASDLRRAAKRS